MSKGREAKQERKEESLIYLLFLHIVDPRIDPAKCILKIRFDFILTEHSITYQPFLKRKRNFGHLAHWIVIITPSLSLSLLGLVSQIRAARLTTRETHSPLFFPFLFSIDREGVCLGN